MDRKGFVHFRVSTAQRRWHRWHAQQSAVQTTKHAAGRSKKKGVEQHHNIKPDLTINIPRNYKYNLAYHKRNCHWSCNKRGILKGTECLLGDTKVLCAWLWFVRATWIVPWRHIQFYRKRSCILLRTSRSVTLSRGNLQINQYFIWHPQGSDRVAFP